VKLLPRLSRFIMELSRRRVMRAAGIYLVTLWLLAQGVADLFPAFGLPDWSVRVFVLFGFAGFPVVIWLAWQYELTPQGLVPDSAIADSEATLVDFPVSGVAKVYWEAEGGGAMKDSFQSECVIGRDPGNAIQIRDRRVSRRHARVFPERGAWWVEDMGSSNGTYLDGEKIERKQLGVSNELQLHPEGPRLRVEIVGGGGGADVTLVGGLGGGGS
jgi:hypothetical protein